MSEDEFRGRGRPGEGYRAQAPPDGSNQLPAGHFGQRVPRAVPWPRVFKNLQQLVLQRRGEEERLHLDQLAQLQQAPDLIAAQPGSAPRRPEEVHVNEIRAQGHHDPASFS